jgi:hypothetical protein
MRNHFATAGRPACPDEPKENESDPGQVLAGKTGAAPSTASTRKARCSHR